MIVIVLISVALGGLLVWALYAERVAPRPVPAVAPAQTLHTGADVAGVRFPLVIAGYSAKRVDAHLQRVSRLVDELRTQAVHTEAGSSTAQDRNAATDLAAQQALGGSSSSSRLGSVLDDV